MSSASGNNQIPYQYEIQFQVIIQSNAVDLSTYIGAVILTHSIDESQPLFTISINTQILQSLNSNYDYAILTVNSYLENMSLLNTNTYELIPYTIASKTEQSNASQNSFFDASMTTINFVSKSCYQVLTYPVNDTIMFNTNLQNILNKIKPSNCNFILDNNIDTENIQQIHIPQQSLQGVLEYIKYWNEYYPGATIITTFPDANNTETANVLITDLHKNIVSGNVDFNVLQVLAGQDTSADNLAQQYMSNSNVPLIVCANTISYQSHVPRNITVSNYNVVMKPLDDLYSNQTFGIDIINSYGVVQGTVDTTLDNAKQLENNSIQNIYGHTGSGGVSTNWFTSNITRDMSKTNFVNIMVNQKIIFGTIWAGQLFNLIISDINAQKHSGVYLLESVSFQLVNRGVSWDSGIHLIGVRSNFFNNQTE